MGFNTILQYNSFEVVASLYIDRAKKSYNHTHTLNDTINNITETNGKRTNLLSSFFTANTLLSKMQEAAAYILLVLGGNATPSADDVKNVITAAGAEANDDLIATLVGDMEGKTVDDLLAAGMDKLKDVPMGGGGGGGAAAEGGAAAVEEVVEEEEEEEQQAPAVDMFGGGDAGGGDY
jgi:large subunit ribosomal protein LP2